MTAINLIPAFRRDARRRRHEVRICIAVCTVYVIAAMSASAACRVVLGGDDARIDQQLAQVAQEIDRCDKAKAATLAGLADAHSRVAANRHILAQPDWSLLMALLAREAGDAIVLRSCNLRSEEQVQISQAPSAKGVEPSHIMRRVLHVSGVGKSSQAVSQFIFRLEDTKLFSKVAMIDTSRENFLDGEVFAFRIDCPLNDAK